MTSYSNSQNPAHRFDGNGGRRVGWESVLGKTPWKSGGIVPPSMYPVFIQVPLSNDLNINFPLIFHFMYENSILLQ